MTRDKEPKVGYGAVTFRPATDTDAPEILRLIKSLAAIEGRPDSVTSTEQAVKRLISGPKSPATVLIMLSDAKLVGYAMTARKFSSFHGFDVIYIEDIVIDPESKGAGFGKRFMAELARRAVADGAGRLEWSAVTYNRSAIQFYQHLGAEEETGRVHFSVEKNTLTDLAAFGETV